MPELEQELAVLGREVAYPPTPRVAETVADRLATAGRPRRPRGTSPRHVVAIAIASALLLAGAAAAAVPSARNDVLDLIGLRGATVERRTVPAAAPLTRLDLGEPTSLAAARRSLSFRPLLPARLGKLHRVFVRRSRPAGSSRSSTYRGRACRGSTGCGQLCGNGEDCGSTELRIDRVGLLVGEFRGDLAPELLGKVAGRRPASTSSQSAGIARFGSRAAGTRSSIAPQRADPRRHGPRRRQRPPTRTRQPADQARGGVPEANRDRDRALAALMREATATARTGRGRQAGQVQGRRR